MSRGIDTGVNKLHKKRTEDQIQSDLINKSWHDIKHKIDGILMSGNTLKTQDTIKACQELDSMTTTQRILHIEHRFGPQYQRLVQPLLHQLESIEKTQGK